MSDLPNVSALMRRVKTRLRASLLAASMYRWFLAASFVFLAGVLLSRLTGLLPPAWFGWNAAAVVPLVAVLGATLSHRRPTPSESARRIDLHARARDLFLTVCRLDRSAGGFQELVRLEAEQVSQGIRPAEVIPFRWQKRLPWLLMSSLLLVLALSLIPQFDPFGRVQAAEATTEAVRTLRQSQKATIARADQLKRDRDRAGDGETEADKELKKLTAALRKMQPGLENKDRQAKILINRKQDLNRLFKRLNQRQLREMLSKQTTDQSFGGETSQKFREWLQDLQQGKSDKLTKELSSLQDELRKLGKIKDPVERAKKARELKKRLQDMATFAGDKANSKQLAQAIQRAMEQMEAGRMNEEISREAMQAAIDSLELSKQEAKELAQAVQELKKLEEALKAAQMARQLNDEGRLDGSEAEGLTSIEDYAELYAQMMGEDGARGPGGNGEGQGEGGPPAEEDDSADSSFKKEESIQQLQAGKHILSWKTRGLSDKGELKKEVADSIRTVKQGVSEAIRKEQVPPGYVDSIKKYFDNIENAVGSADK